MVFRLVVAWGCRDANPRSQDKVRVSWGRCLVLRDAIHTIYSSCSPKHSPHPRLTPLQVPTVDTRKLTSYFP